jgi:hypothetical protein
MSLNQEAATNPFEDLNDGGAYLSLLSLSSLYHSHCLCCWKCCGDDTPKETNAKKLSLPSAFLFFFFFV